jgi:tetratricopeptide (TPR) repeat protein
MATQVLDIAIKFRYKSDESFEPFLILNGGKQYHFGDRIDDDCGLINTELDERFWKYFCLMALRRYYDIDEGWVSAKELNELFDSKTSPDAQSVKKYFSRRIMRYENRPTRPNYHLIKYFPQEREYGSLNIGLSHGPYRVSLGVPHLRLNLQECWGYILGPERIIKITLDFSPLEVIEQADSLFSEGRLIENRLLLNQILGHLYVRQNQKNLQLLGDLWHKLSITEMHLGISRASIISADNALDIYRKIGRNNYAISDCFHTKANAYGQLNLYDKAISACKDAEHLLKGRISSIIKNTQALSHVLVNKGKFISILGNSYTGKNVLEKAKDKAMSGCTLGTVATMDIRLAQHYIRNQNWKPAENIISKIDGITKQLNTNEFALFLRTNCEFFVHTKQWDEARKWCKITKDFGIQQGRRNLMRRLESIIAELKRFGQWEGD